MQQRFESLAHRLVDPEVIQRGLERRNHCVHVCLEVVAEMAQTENLAFELRGEVENLVLVLGANLDGKAHLTIMISENLVNDPGLDARKLAREVSAEIKGGGGGQDFYVTAGGKNPEGIPRALDKIRSLVEQTAGK